MTAFCINNRHHAQQKLLTAISNQPDWQKAFWGSNYSKLLEIKNKYDPDGLFYCHHCVGSELWQENGMCPV